MFQTFGSTGKPLTEELLQIFIADLCSLSLVNYLHLNQFFIQKQPPMMLSKKYILKKIQRIHRKTPMRTLFF